MKRLYKISGSFAGWKNESTNRLYDNNGNNVGYFKGEIAYSLNGDYIGEIIKEDYIGMNMTKTYTVQTPVSPSVGISLAPYVDRVGMSISGWQDPNF